MKPPVQTIINQARQIARQESKEFLKLATNQVTPSSETPPQNEPEKKPEENKIVNNDYLEEEMERFRELRRQKEEEIRNAQLEEEQKRLQSVSQAPVEIAGKSQGRAKGWGAKIQKLKLGSEVRGDKSKD